MLKEMTPKTSKQMKSKATRLLEVCVTADSAGMEQNVVPWKRDKDDKRCGGCGQTFGLRRRRHHCRLCGEIRCKECCRFKTFADTCAFMCVALCDGLTFLLILSDPLLQGCPDYQDLAPPEAIPKKKFNFKQPKKEGSSVDDDEVSDEVRMCVPCKKLLER